MGTKYYASIRKDAFMKKIIISPFSRNLRNGNLKHPKNYPYWETVIDLLHKDEIRVVHITQNPLEYIGADEVVINPELNQIKELLLNSCTWASVDNFLHHFASLCNIKGVAIFSQSDPNIFGHENNVNLLKDRSYLRSNQFLAWEEAEYKEEAFVDPNLVHHSIMEIIKGKH